MPSPQFEAIYQLLKTNPSPIDMPFVEQRRLTADMAAQTPLPDTVYHEEIRLGAVSGLLLAAEGARDDRLILYLHGGGYCLGSSLAHRDFGWRLSAAAQARVLLPDYRLAPEHPFPAAVMDVTAVYRYLLQNGFQPNQIAFGGDSAGGGLVIAAMIALRDDGIALPKTAVLISPWTDLAGTGRSLTEKNDQDPLLSPAQLDRFVKAYLGNTDPRSPLASPLYADLFGLPPLLIQVGTAEILLDDAVRLAERAKTAGVDATLDVWDDMFHVWHGFAAIIPEAQAALDKTGAFMRKQFEISD